MGSCLICQGRARVPPLLPASIPELVDELGGSRQRVYACLASSERAGLVARIGSVPRLDYAGRPGRPSVLWDITDKGRRALASAGIATEQEIAA